MPDVKKDRGLFVKITSIRELDVAVTLVGSLIKLVELYSLIESRKVLSSLNPSFGWDISQFKYVRLLSCHNAESR